MIKNPRILSIQSHVVTGYVGNKAATFPLQLHGFDVDPLNTVQFSNHTGFPSWRGMKCGADHIYDIMEGLSLSGFLNKQKDQRPYYTHALSGYLGSENTVKAVHVAIEKLKASNADICYLCDPVMGDHGKIYVSESVIPVYRDQLIPLADIITPNQFEAELLTGISITSRQLVRTAIEKIHEMNVEKVVITSLECLPGTPDDCMTLVGSDRSVNLVFQISFKKFPGKYTGTGDLFASLLLAYMNNQTNSLKNACEMAISVMHKVLKRTFEYATESAQHGGDIDEIIKIRNHELRLIDCRFDILDPQVLYHAVSFE